MNPAANPATSKAKTRAATARDYRKAFATGEFIGKSRCAAAGAYIAEQAVEIQENRTRRPEIAEQAVEIQETE